MCVSCLHGWRYSFIVSISTYVMTPRTCLLPLSKLNQADTCMSRGCAKRTHYNAGRDCSWISIASPFLVFRLGVITTNLVVVNDVNGGLINVPQAVLRPLVPCRVITVGASTIHVPLETPPRIMPCGMNEQAR